MKQTNKLIIALLAAFVLLISIPFLVPHTGFLALVAFVPLLCAERVASQTGVRHFFWWYFAAFALWNALTTWWVCEATVGGGIFAVVANAAQMALVFGVFRLSKKRLQGVLPYILLACLWTAWERWYMVSAEISWPWLTLGNAFARTTSLIQWYEVTGVLGGTLWIWASALSIFGIMVALSDGTFARWNAKARVILPALAAIVVLGPAIASEIRYATYTEESEGTLDVTLAQSNFDPYHKLKATSQRDQNAQVVDLFHHELDSLYSLEGAGESVRLLMLPETFTSDIWMNWPQDSPTWKTFQGVLAEYPNVNLLFGASVYELFNQRSKPSILARPYGGSAWYESHNAAFLTDRTGRTDHCYKNKLVVGTELTPYPKIFAPLDDKLGGLMGRCIGQGYVSTLDVVSRDSLGAETGRIALGVPICYESVYSEYCTGYVKAGAKALAVITNDGWWGDTPGYRQHFSYSRIRAIELRRDVARCANTGISGFINQRGDVLQQSGWWVPDAISSRINLSSRVTFFAQHGDIAGSIATLVAGLLVLLLCVQFLTSLGNDKKSKKK